MLKLKWVFLRIHFYMPHNVLAYRLVAGKLAIIFQFMILTSRKSKTLTSITDSAMSDMQCCRSYFFHCDWFRVKLFVIKIIRFAPIFIRFRVEFLVLNFEQIFIIRVELNVRFDLKFRICQNLNFYDQIICQLSDNQSNFQRQKNHFA